MTPVFLIGIIVLGLLTGAVSGMLGIGGGLIVVPALTLIFGLSQKEAVGTSLAMMIPPVGLFAVWTYYSNNHVNLKIAIALAIAFVIGTLITSLIVTRYEIPDDFLRKFFAFFMLYAAGNMLFKSDKLLYSSAKTVLIMAGYFTLMLLLGFLGKRWSRQLKSAEVFQQQIAKPVPDDYMI